MHLSHSFLFNHPILGLITMLKYVFHGQNMSKHSTASGMVLDPITKDRLRFWAYNPTFDSDSGGGGQCIWNYGDWISWRSREDQGQQSERPKSWYTIRTFIMHIIVVLQDLIQREVENKTELLTMTNIIFNHLELEAKPPSINPPLHALTLPLRLQLSIGHVLYEARDETWPSRPPRPSTNLDNSAWNKAQHLPTSPNYWMVTYGYLHKHHSSDVAVRCSKVVIEFIQCDTQEFDTTVEGTKSTSVAYWPYWYIYMTSWLIEVNGSNSAVDSWHNSCRVWKRQLAYPCTLTEMAKAWWSWRSFVQIIQEWMCLPRTVIDLKHTQTCNFDSNMMVIGWIWGAPIFFWQRGWYVYVGWDDWICWMWISSHDQTCWFQVCWSRSPIHKLI